MLTAILLAGVCLNPPYYDPTGTGPVCTVQNQECKCSECGVWDIPDGGTAPTSYEINREDVAAATFQTVGTVTPQAFDEAGTTRLNRLWCFAKDLTFPQEGRLYRYKVRACADSNCGTWSNVFEYIAPPYACYTATGEIQCYPGDPKTH